MSKSNEIDDLRPVVSCPLDPRFQNTNVTRYCFTHYIDYHRCTYLLGKEEISCDIFKNTYRRMCPNAWIDTWDKRREKGIFARDCKTELD